MEKLRFYSWWLLGIIIVSFVMEAMFPQIIKMLSFKPSLILAMPWTIITSSFMHADLSHLLQNMFALGLFGIILERIIGSKNFLVLYFSGAVMGNIASFFFYPNSLSLGASGAIMAVVGALTMLRPKLVLYIGGPLPMILLAFMWVVIDLVGIFSPDTGIGHAAHLAGFGFGAIYGYVMKEKYSQEREIKNRAELEISEEYLDAWERKYMK
ncbi:MAG: rhomboid family intramembrane serine protease [Candidatus Aenigmarchaeota archaeon]|nr:rhomboid family intramembrane serine protease [Candidatus Aenigmarchaeota archaeon]